MRSISLAAFAAATVFCCVAPAIAQRPSQELPDLAKDYQWREEAGRHGLSPACVELLARQKVLVTGESFKQVFDPYIRSGLPLFITSDSLLNAFHVLYEESVLRLETANARRLPGILQFVWKNLEIADARVRGPADLTAQAKIRAQVVIGTALRLLGDDSIQPTPEVAALIAKEVEKVTEATATDKPAWLGPPNDMALIAIVYSRYKPRGFYTKSADLERYFRAVSWLQSIPFRVDRDEEFLSILMLASAIAPQGEEAAPEVRACRDYLACFRQLIGVGDDWDLAKAASLVQEGGIPGVGEGEWPQVHERLKEATKKWGDGPMINDQYRLPPMPPLQASEPNFRILSAYRTPDAVLFHRTTDLRDVARPLPTGLEVAAALGSDFARSKIISPDKDWILKTIDEAKPLFQDSSLYFDYLDCLRPLLGKPDPGAPAFMSGEVWQAKSCQTALGGWAQLRHTWALQAKQSVTYACASILPPGFVEPQPEFFARMARLVERTRKQLDRAGPLKLDPRIAADEIRRYLAFEQRVREQNKSVRDAYNEASQEERFLEHRVKYELVRCLDISAENRWSPEYEAEATEKMKALADRLGRGEVPDNPKLQAWLEQGQPDLAPLWTKLGDLCRGLEVLAHKQLRGVPLSKEDGHFIMGYGVRIAGIMFYGGNSYVNPCDDAPRLVDVHSDSKGEKYLEVGIGRPRAIYVLYPYKGGEVLCRGAVMPYYEFPSATRLTDAEWKDLLDSEAAPELPEWVKPIIGPGMARPTAPAEVR